jgi:hypothetical protein
VSIRSCSARPVFVPPLGPADSRHALDFFAPAASYGVRAIELRHADDRPRLATLKVPGLVVLYEQRRPPWTFPGRLDPATLARLRRAGAHVEAATTVDWPGETLRDFVLFDGLMHEIGHHIVQHATGKRTARVMRTADHERRADAFAAACRLAWPR